MEFNFAKKQVKRINRNKIILMIILIACVATMILAFAPSLGSLYSGTHTFKTAKEAQALMDDGKEFVSITVDELYDTGYSCKENDKIVYRYYIFWADDKFIMCKVDKDLTEEIYEDYELSGKLEKATGMESDVISKLKLESGDSSSVVTFYLNSEYSRIWAQIGVAIGVLLIVIMFGVVIKAVINMSNYQGNKFFKKMGADEASAERLNQIISSLFASGMTSKKIQQMNIMGEWIISTSFMGFTVCNKDDIVWMYKSVTKHRTNGIPTGKTYGLVLRGKNKEHIGLSAKSDKVADEMLQELYAEMPCVIMGYSDELSELYEKQTAGFLEMREKYRQEREQNQ